MQFAAKRKGQAFQKFEVTYKATWKTTKNNEELVVKHAKVQEHHRVAARIAVLSSENDKRIEQAKAANPKH